MPFNGRLTYCLIGLLITFSSVGQDITLAGKVVDAETDLAIPFVSIGIINDRIGTSTNEQGEFEIRTDSLPVSLVFSHLSYDRRAIIAYEEQDLLIKMVPVPKLLDAITVQGKKRRGFIEKLVWRAYQKVQKSSHDVQYGKAFYRQKSLNNNLYTELYEIFYDAKFSNNGLKDWEVQEGRYAINLHKVDENQLVNRNFTLLTRILTMVSPPTDDVIMPIHPKLKDWYSYGIKEVIKMGDRQVAVLAFKPLKYLSAPAFEGEVSIDIENYDILKVKGTIADDRLKFVKLTREGYWKDYRLNYEIAYKDDRSRLLLDYIRVTQDFDYYVDDEFQFPVNTNSWLTFYEYYNPRRRNKRLGGRLRFKKSDAAILDQLGYSGEFWDNNPIVKRTPVEEEVIASFEEQKAFGTIYLNNQKQIVLEKKDLLKDPFVNELRFDFKVTSRLQEKVYLHLDKPFYTSGEDIWYSAYLVDGATHLANTQSSVLYVELINPDLRVIDQQALKIVDGQAIGDIHLPGNLPTGKYRIRAYTNWMLNFDPDFFYSREMAIYNANSLEEKEIAHQPEVNMRFYPEGGNSVTGMVNRVAFKVVNHLGEGIPVKGEILNGNDKVVSRIESNDLGFGSFFILPEKEDDYYARIGSDDSIRTFQMPKSDTSGFVIKVNNQMTNAIVVTVQATAEFDETTFYLVGQSRGRIFHLSKEIVTADGLLVEIPKARLPDGVFQITLFDEEGRPRAERLIYIDHEIGPDLEIYTDHETYDPREEFELRLKITDANGLPAKANLSVAVTDSKATSKTVDQENILSYLMLSSDIKGWIEDPGHYFTDRSKQTLQDLDLLMLTQGWRRFAWTSVLDKKAPPSQYEPERNGLTVLGLALDKQDKSPLEYTDLSALFISKDRSIVVALSTDDQGKFKIGGMDYLDTADIFFKKLASKNFKSTNLSVLAIDRQPVLVGDQRTKRSPSDLTKDQNIVAYLEGDRERKSIELAYGGDTRLLRGITIQDQRLSNLVRHGTPDAVIIPDEEIYTDIFQMISGRVPGVTVTGRGNNADIRIRDKQGSPLVLLNGNQFVLPGTRINRGQAINALMTIPPAVVDRIEVLKGTSASVYGMAGNNGVIAIYTKEDPDQVTSLATDEIRLPSDTRPVSLKVRGYYAAREFYSPDYSISTLEQSKPDKRVTLYWNGEITTDTQGEATLNFYNSDIGKNFQIDLQGITDDGQPFSCLISVGSMDENP